MTTPVRLTLTRPDDWHLHLRDGAVLVDVLPHTARQFARAIVMPNLKPAVTTTESAQAYRARIRAALPARLAFEPLMTLYLTDATPAEEIRRARGSGFVHGVKLYPAGATTNSASGVTSLERCARALEAMQEVDLPLLVHGEVTHAAVDVFDRESVFIETVLEPTRRRFPALRIVFEHITTREAVAYVQECRGTSRHGGPILGATITAHHLLFNRNALFLTAQGQTGMRPHYYCLPVLKREMHRAALLGAATGGDPRFFLGTDSAPHPRGDKENDCGCAGCFTAAAAMEMYAAAFESAGALDRLEAFASFHGPDFYGLARNRGTVALERVPWTLPRELKLGSATVVPLGGGEPLAWKWIG
ncbi:MAG TPA: dihydroorotase [Burkholderiaceae bacterium]|nr:dihydroorotase [Burkholderiaceae bacterium]